MHSLSGAAGRIVHEGGVIALQSELRTAPGSPVELDDDYVIFFLCLYGDTCDV